MAPFGDAVGLVVRSELRARWRGLLVIALLVGLVGTVAIGALAGARRTSTALDRFVEATAARDAAVITANGDEADQVVAALEDEPWVTAVARVSSFPLALDFDTTLNVDASPQTAFASTVDRPLVLEGRPPLPDSAEEIAINEAARDQLDLEIGDRVVGGTYSPRTLECIRSQTCFEVEPGPELSLLVIGIVRTVDALKGSDISPAAIASVPFYDRHHDEVGTITDVPRVRLADGADGLDRLDDAVGEVTGEDGNLSSADEDYRAAPDDAVEVSTTSLLAFAVLAVAAGGVIIGQAVTRHVSRAAVGLVPLGPLGLTRRQRITSMTIPVIGALATGGALGAAGATATSPIFPVGGARLVEPDRGVEFDPTVILPAALALVLGLAMVGIGAAVGATRTRPRRRVGRNRLPWFAPVEVGAGIRQAVERRRGPVAIPVRSAMAGVALGVAGLLGTGVVVASATDLVDRPERWGWTWDLGGTVADVSPLRDSLPGVAEVSGIEAVAIKRAGLLEIDGLLIAANAFEASEGDIDFTVVRGEPADDDGEIALGETLMRDLDVDIGDDVVAVDGEGDEHELRIVGSVAAPSFAARDPGAQAALTFATWSEVTQSAGVSELAIELSPGADPDEVRDDLFDDWGIDVFEPRTPGRLHNLAEAMDVARALGAFFALIAVLGLLHALVTSVRRRRHDFGVWRALGFTTGQVRRSVIWQGVAIGAVGGLLGLPLGLLAGRVVWGAIVDDLGVVEATSVPIALALCVVPAALAIGLLAATGPAWSAGRGPAARDLRTE